MPAAARVTTLADWTHLPRPTHQRQGHPERDAFEARARRDEKPPSAPRARLTLSVRRPYLGRGTVATPEAARPVAGRRADPRRSLHWCVPRAGRSPALYRAGRRASGRTPRA